MVSLKYEIKQFISDLYKHLNNATVEGVDDEMYLDLKYTNHENIQSYLETHQGTQIRLLEQVAIRDFMSQDATIIEDKLKIYEETI